MPCEFVQGTAYIAGGTDYLDGDTGTGGEGRTYPYRQVVTVPANTTRTETVTDGQTLANAYYDTRKPGAGLKINASGDDWEVSHIVTGGTNNADGAVVTGQTASSGSTPTGAVADSVLVNDGSTEKPEIPQGESEFVAFDSEATYDQLDYSKINLNSFVSSPAVEGNALEILIPEGEHTGSNMNFGLDRFPGSLPEEAWAEIYVQFGPDFYVEESGKAAGGFAHLREAGGAGGGDLADGTNGWSARLIFLQPEGDGDLHLGSYFYHGQMDGPYGDGYYWDAPGELNTGQWYKITQYVKMNTPGQSNGIYRGWVDGQLAYDKRDLYFRDEGYGDTLRVGNFWMHHYYGGSPTPNHDIRVYIDNLTVSTTRVDDSLETP